MNLGFFGGTFDPIHIGHVHLVEMARDQLALDKVIVMPAGHPYHKTHAVSMMTYRYAMCKLALKNKPGIEISTIEMLRRGPSYTLETVLEIKSSLQPGDNLYLICGLDVVLQIHLWYEAAKLLKMMKIAAFVRPGVDREAAEERAAVLRSDFDADIAIYDAPAIDVSSTDIRKAIRNGEQDEDLPLPKKVLSFIDLHQLYHKEQVLESLQPETLTKLAGIETILFRKLSLKRLLHSLDTMYYAVALALRFNVDPDKAALAALMHDVGRETKVEELWELSGDVPERWKGSLAFLHAPAAATSLIPALFDVHDPEILDAVRWHTTLNEGASDLAKVIFLADKSEPGRQFSDLDKIRQLSEVDLDLATLACLEAVENFAVRMNFTPEPYSHAALQDLRESVARKSR